MSFAVSKCVGGGGGSAVVRGLKLSVTPKQIPTEAIVSSVKAVLSRQHELSESNKDNIRIRVTSTLQSTSLPS